MAAAWHWCPGDILQAPLKASPPTAFWNKRSKALRLQGGNGLDKLSCFHSDYFSFKPCASIELIMKMVSLASPPSIPLLPLMLVLFITSTVLIAARSVAVCPAEPALVHCSGDIITRGASPSHPPTTSSFQKRQSFRWGEPSSWLSWLPGGSANSTSGSSLTQNSPPPLHWEPGAGGLRKRGMHREEKCGG